MTQQQLSTPSIVDIRDLVILASAGHTSLGILARDPWDTVLTKLDLHALDPINIVPALDTTPILPGTTNPFVTLSHLNRRFLGAKVYRVIGPVGSGADFEGNDEAPFEAAVADLVTQGGGMIAVKPGTYIFSHTVNIAIPSVSILGVHPLAVTIQASGDFSTFTLSGENSSLEGLTFEAPLLASYPVVQLLGDGCQFLSCKVTNFSAAGVQISGNKCFVGWSRIESDSAMGILTGGVGNRIMGISFGGQLVDGALVIEGDLTSIIGCYFSSALIGSAYKINSPENYDNRLVGNHYESSTALSLSVDNGTGTIRYGNTPNNFIANVNNILLPLTQYVGESTLTTTDMALGNTGIQVEGSPPGTNYLSESFTIDPLTTHDTTKILGGDVANPTRPSEDLFIKYLYEERNFFLTSDDPTYSVSETTLGQPLSGYFIWDGTPPNPTLTWPDFKLKSVLTGNEWSIAASSAVIHSGEALTIRLDRETPGPVVPALETEPIAANDPVDSQIFVLAFSPAEGILIWGESGRLLTALQWFDVGGLPLPIAKFVGVTDLKNPTAQGSGFCGGAGSDSTIKVGSQSAHLENLFERTNLKYLKNSTGEVRIETDPNGWYGTGVINGINDGSNNSLGTHFLSFKGSTYTIVPATSGLVTSGLYRFNRDASLWVQIAGNPMPGGTQYTALSFFGLGFALLTITGVVVIYDPETSLWTFYTPTISADISLPFASARGAVPFWNGGFADYAVQTPDYTLFSTLDGKTIRYQALNNTLDLTPKIYGDFCSTSLWGQHSKDSGFNLLSDPKSPTSSDGSNGFTATDGLPLGVSVGNFTTLVPPQTLSTIKWDNSYYPEAFAHNPDNGAFLAVYKDSLTSTWFIFTGGKGNGQLVSKVTSSTFTNFTLSQWVLDVGQSRVYALGKNPITNDFIMWVGSYTSGIWSWVGPTLIAVGQAKGVSAALEYSTGDIWALTSDPTQALKPTLFKYTNSSNFWSTVGTFVGATAGSFDYNGGTDLPKGSGVVTSTRISFLVRDDSRGGRPTYFYYDRVGLTFNQITIGNVSGDFIDTRADIYSYYESLGCFYNPALDTIHWFTLANSPSGNQVVHYIYWLGVGTLSSWMIKKIGGTASPDYLAGTSIGSAEPVSGSRAAMSHTVTDLSMYSRITTTVYLWMGMTGIISGTLVDGIWSSNTFSSQTWAANNKTLPYYFSLFSNAPVSTHQPLIGVSRADMSLQIGSMVESLDIQGLANVGCGSFSAESGVVWHKPGVELKNPASGIWFGIIGTTLWLANTNTSSKIQLEIGKDLPATVASMSTYDVATATYGGSTYYALAFQNGSLSNRLSIYLYNATAGTVVLENPGGATLGSTPKIEWNVGLNKWVVVAQDLATKKLIFYTRDVVGAWTTENPFMVSNSCIYNAKPVCLVDGTVFVAMESGLNASLKIMKRSPVGAWSVLADTPFFGDGGFRTPEMLKSSYDGYYWVFGTASGIAARIAYSADGISWSVYANPVSNSYGYLSGTCSPAVCDLGNGTVVVAGKGQNSSEMLIFNFTPATASGSGFASKGRLQTSYYSTDEEDTVGAWSFTWEKVLLYSATRPSRAYPHWSRRISLTNPKWGVTGDSLLGSGRGITIGKWNHFRERWVDEPNQDSIVWFLKTAGGLQSTTWSELPLGRYKEKELIVLRWPYSADVSSTPLFKTGSWGLLSDAAALGSGRLQASSTRLWPVILGSGTGLVPGSAGTVYWGEMLGVLPPVGVSNATYFWNSVIAGGNIIKATTQNKLSFYGTHYWQDQNRSYTIVGPYSLILDASVTGSHLYLILPSSFNLDLTSSLSGWVNLNYPDSTIHVVIGELKDNYFLYYNNPLMLTVPEPREVSNWHDMEWGHPIKSGAHGSWGTIGWEINAITSDNIKMREEGTLRGYQTIDFSGVTIGQVLLKRDLPTGLRGEDWILWFPRSLVGPIATNSRIQQIAGRLIAGGNLEWEEEI